MHSTSNPATIIQGEFIAMMVTARSLLQHSLHLPLPIGCLASR